MGRILVVGSPNIIALNIPRPSKHEIHFASRRRAGQRVMTGISRNLEAHEGGEHFSRATSSI